MPSTIGGWAMNDRTHELREEAYLTLIEKLRKEKETLLKELLDEMIRGDALSTALNNTLPSFPEGEAKKSYQRVLDDNRWSEYKYRRNQA
jgi:hypothetical protein